MSSNADPGNAQAAWLAYAPQLPDLAADKKWHVFLSYRSVHRDWALHLYDALTQAGFRVFLDQFQLVPGTSLVASLSEALSQSAAGVILWSTQSADSQWCQTEYESMHNAKARPGSTFRFVVIKTDAQDLPLFAQNSLYEDFSNSPEGPHGAGLLRVMYGLIGQPLSEGAVRFAQQIDEQTKAQIAKVDGANEIGDAQLLFSLGTSRSLPWVTSPVLACRAATALIGLGEVDNALDVLTLAEETFPQSIRPKQLKALALARSGQWSEAQRILSELYAGGHRDPETLGIYARTWMDRYKSSGKLRHLEKSRDLYAEAFRITPNDYYTGINAASKSILLRELDTGVELASKVEAIVGVQKVPGDYWKSATVAEVQLIRKNYDKAAQLYRDAVSMNPESRGDHQSTLAQARLLMDVLEPAVDQRQVVEAAFE